MSHGGIYSLFYYHGRQCSNRPVEVLLVCITGTVCLLSLNIYDATHSISAQNESSGEKVSDHGESSFSFTSTSKLFYHFIKYQDLRSWTDL